MHSKWRIIQSIRGRFFHFIAIEYLYWSITQQCQFRSLNIDFVSFVHHPNNINIQESASMLWIKYHTYHLNITIILASEYHITIFPKEHCWSMLLILNKIQRAWQKYLSSSKTSRKWLTVAIFQKWQCGIIDWNCSDT